MEYLRWILLLIGVVILVGIYTAGRFRNGRRSPSQSPIQEWESEPPLSPKAFDDYTEHELQELGSRIPILEDEIGSDASGGEALSRAATSASTGRGGDEKIIVIYAAAPRGQRIGGSALSELAHDAGLEFGEMQIFHRYEPGPEGGRRRVQFSMANLVEPGSFAPETIDSMETPGVALFARFPGPRDGLAALDAMMDFAKRLKSELGAELRDSDRSALSQQTIEHLRDEVREFSRRTATVQSAGQ